MAVKRKIIANCELEPMKLGEAFEEYIQEKEARNLASKTVDNYKKSYRNFLVKTGLENDDEIKMLEKSQVYRYINILKNSDVSVYTINRYVRDLRAFLNWCAIKEYLPPIEIRELKAQETIPKCYDDEDIDKLLIRPSSKNFSEWRTYAIVNTVLATGMRAGSLCALKVGDIDFIKGEIRLEQQKNNKASILPLSSALGGVLKEYIRMFRKAAKSEEYLFCNIGAEPLTTNALRIAYMKYCKEREVAQTSIHGLRHTFARDFIRGGGNPLVLQKLLNHSSLDMTRHYVALFSEDIKSGYDDFSPLDRIKKGTSRKKKV